MNYKYFFFTAAVFLLFATLLSCTQDPPPSSTTVTVPSTVLTTTALPYTSTTSKAPVVTPDDSTTTIHSSTMPSPSTTSPTTSTPMTTPIITEPITTPPETTPAVTTPTVTTPAETTPPPPVTAPEEINNPWTVNCQNFIYLRKEPSYSGKQIGKVRANETVDVIGYDGYFAKVRWNGKTGYVSASFLIRSGEAGYTSDLSIVKPIDNYSYDQMQIDLQLLAECYPDLFTLSSIGKSEEGRDLTLCILGNPDADRRIFIQAAIHGREHVVSLLTLCEIDYLLSHQDMVTDSGETVAELLSQVAIHIVPMSNPDGVTISQTGILPTEFAELYATNPDVAKFWKANAKGIDLNANFDANWELYESIYQSSAPAYAGYKGTSPECAAESIALANYLRSERFDLILSYHTTGSLIYWSYDYENHVEVNNKCYDAATYLAAFSGFTLGQQVTNSTAGLKDYAIQALQTPSLTLEFAISDAPSPFSEFDQIWERGKHTMLLSTLWVLQE